MNYSEVNLDTLEHFTCLYEELNGVGEITKVDDNYILVVYTDTNTYILKSSSESIIEIVKEEVHNQSIKTNMILKKYVTVH